MLTEQLVGARRAIALFAIVLLTPPILGINGLIYYARAAYANLHPEEVAAKPHTISRALTDPRVGDLFGQCLAVLSPMLGIGVFLLVWLALIDWLNTRSGSERPVSARTAFGLGHLLIVLQAMACIGIVMLSSYSLEENRDLHMWGSYLFFVAQLLVIVAGGTWCSFMKSMQAPQPVYRTATLRAAAKFAIIPIAVALTYIGLFFTKDWVSESYWMAVMKLYTRTEPLTISGFLLYLGLFVFELGHFLYRGRSLPKLASDPLQTK